MQAFVQHHLGLVIVSAIMVVAILVLTSAVLQLRAAGLPLKPIAFVAVFFAFVMVPLFAGQLAMAIWPRPKTAIDAESFAGRTTFDYPERIFGNDATAADLRDAKPVFPEMLTNAEVAQLRMRETGEMTLSARFASANDARDSASRFWAAFALTGTSGSEDQGWWGARRSVGDIVHMKRMDNVLAVWIGPNKDTLRQRLADVRFSSTPPDLRPAWIRAFDRLPVKIAAVFLLVALPTVWFFKGSSWAGRIDGEGPPVSAAELSQRLSRLSDLDSLRNIEANVWELIVRYQTLGEVGRYRYLLQFDPRSHRVLVTEFVGHRDSPSGSYNWHKARGITFFRTGAGVDLQRAKRPVVDAITSAGWGWQPVMWNAPAFFQ